MLKSPFYIAEADHPEGFPGPGKVNQVVVKSYPAYRRAVVTNAGSAENRMFGQLFDHIKRNKVAMTAPVEMTFDDAGATSMAFLYGDPTLGSPGRDGSVEVTDRPGVQVVSLGIRGRYTKQRFMDGCRRLEAWLSITDDWESCGEARYLAFNSPFVPGFLRYGEVQIPIQRRT